MERRAKAPLERLGWREWVVLPELGIDAIKAKVDTGARTSSLHAYDVEEFTRRGVAMVRFKVHPDQRSSKRVVASAAPLVEYRRVKSSTGHGEERPVIRTVLEVLERRFEIELTLTRRDVMGFRMLLGRQALRRRFLVDPGRSYFNGKRGKRPKKRTSS